MKIEMNGREIEMDERIENVSVYVDTYNGEIRYTSFEIWASDPTGWTDDVLVSVVELRLVNGEVPTDLVIDPTVAGTCKGLGEYGYLAR